MLKLGKKNKQKQNSLSGFKLMSRDRLSHIHYEMHMLMFPKAVTFECKQYLQQLMISESLMGVCHESVCVCVGGGGVATSGRTLIFDVSHD